MAKEDLRTAGIACLLDGSKLQHCIFEIDLPASIVHTLRAWRVYYYTANYLAQGWSYTQNKLIQLKKLINLRLLIRDMPNSYIK